MMQVNGRPMRPIWFEEKDQSVQVIDQRRLPHEEAVMRLDTVDQVVLAIRQMVVRGAPLIGVTGAYGVLVALKTAAGEEQFRNACRLIRQARPTAVNLAWAVDRVLAEVLEVQGMDARLEAARQAETGPVRPNVRAKGMTV